MPTRKQYTLRRPFGARRAGVSVARERTYTWTDRAHYFGFLGGRGRAQSLALNLLRMIAMCTLSTPVNSPQEPYLAT